MNEDQVKAALFAEFLVWMRGQTVSQNEAAETIYYPWDVAPFVAAVARVAKKLPIHD